MHLLLLCLFLADSLSAMFLSLDEAFIAWFDHFARHSWAFDYSVYRISDNHLLKGGIFLTVIWGLWFRRGENKERDHALVVSTLAACVVAIAINKGVQMAVPFRPRPYLANLPGIVFPYDLGMRKESSFPSDHAALFFALSASLWFFSRRLGLLACLYTTVVICLPRVYLGLHYPSDLIVGASIGIASACLLNGSRLHGMVARPALAFAEKHPGFFFPGLFLFSYLLATLFDDLRMIAGLLQMLVHH